MHRRVAVLFLLSGFTLALFAGTAAAALTVTSISVAEGPVSGGTVVEIRGTGFQPDQLAPVGTGTRVFFGDTPATSVEFFDSTRLRVVTPARLPGTVTVTVTNMSGESVKVANAFTFVGETLTAFDAFLFPIFTPPINGASGSRFVTRAMVVNAGRITEPPVELYGHDVSCGTRPGPGEDEPLILEAHQEETELVTLCSTWPARFFYVPKPQSKNLASSLRVTDVTRQAETHGVEIPVVRLDHFTKDRITLVGIPSDPRFRLTLRIYGVDEGDRNVRVWIDDARAYSVQLTPGHDRYEPAYATFTAFPPRSELRGDQSQFRVVVETARDSSGDQPAANSPRIWAFVSVTNNETQAITTVTPQQHP